MKLFPTLARFCRVPLYWRYEPPVVPYEGLAKAALRLPAAPRICLLKLDMVGDLLVFLPAAQKLRDACPGAYILLVCGSWNAELATRSGLFDQIVTYDFWSYTDRRQKRRDDDLSKDVANLRLGHFDLAIDYRHDGDTRSLLGLIDATFRAGYSSSDPRARLDLALPDMEKHARRRGFTPLHARLRLDLLSEAVISTFLSDTNESFTGRSLALSTPEADLPDGPYVVIGIGAGQPVRQWPLENFITLAERLLAESDRKIVLVGSAKESTDTRTMCRHLPPGRCIDTAGQRSLGEVVDLIAGAELFIGNDAGLAHIADHESVPSVIILGGAGNKHVWAPTGRATEVLTAPMPCSPCYLRSTRECPFSLRCLTAIKVDDVYQAAIRATLSKRPAPAPIDRPVLRASLA